jgi:hypothetical protein
VKRLLLLTVAAVATAALLPAPASATNECEGLLVCVPVAGPWVVVPPRGAEVEYQLTCPRGHVVGGLDAELSVRAIDISFVGKIGAPVNPGISTARSVVFVAAHVGTIARAPSFRPHVGCMPAAGGGGGVRTIRRPQAVAAPAVVPPGEPTVRRVKTIRIRPGSRLVVSTCRPRERLVGASHAFGFYTEQPPTASLISTVTGRRRVAGRRVSVVARGDAELVGVRAVVQVHAVCSRLR